MGSKAGNSNLRARAPRVTAGAYHPVIAKLVDR